MYRILILFISALLVAAQALLGQKINITDEYIEDLACDFAANTYDLFKNETLNRLLKDEPFKLPEGEDFRLKSEMLKFQVLPGNVDTKRFRFNRSDSEVSVRFGRTFKDLKMKGQMNITGIVKGEPINQLGNITIQWARVKQFANLSVVSSPVTGRRSIEKLNNNLKLLTPTTTIESEPFAGIPSEETKRHLDSFSALYQREILAAQNHVNKLTRWQALI